MNLKPQSCGCVFGIARVGGQGSGPLFSELAFCIILTKINPW